MLIIEGVPIVFAHEDWEALADIENWVNAFSDSIVGPLIITIGVFGSNPNENTTEAVLL